MAAASAKPITRKAVGRVLDLGHLYDARADRGVAGTTLHGQPVPDGMVRELSDTYTEMNYSESDSLDNRMALLKVEASLKLSVLGGAVRLEASGSYLSEASSSETLASASVRLSTRTVTRSYDVLSDDLSKSDRAFQDGFATHVVTKISYGADVVVTFSYEARDKAERQRLQGSLSGSIKAIAAALSGSGEVDEKTQAAVRGFRISICGDVPPPGGALPSTPAEAFAYLRSVPELLRATGSGNGRPIEYEMYPLASLASGSDVRVARLLREFNDAAISRAVRVVGEAEASAALVDAYAARVRLVADVLPRELVAAFRTKSQEAREYLQEMRQVIHKAMVAFRGSNELEAGDNPLLAALGELARDARGPCGVSDFLDEQWPAARSGVDAYEALVRAGIELLGRRDDLQSVVLRAGGHLYVLYASRDMAAADSSLYVRTYGCMLTLRGEADDAAAAGPGSEPAVFVVVDIGLHPNLRLAGAAGEKPLLQHYYRRALVDADVVASVDRDGATNLFRAVDPAVNVVVRPERSRKFLARFMMRCAGSIGAGQCPSEPVAWTCLKCREEAELSTDRFVFCSCGAVGLDKVEMRCSNPKHGGEYVSFAADVLERLMRV